jgi:hypothetical protein
LGTPRQWNRPNRASCLAIGQCEKFSHVTSATIGAVGTGGVERSRMNHAIQRAFDLLFLGTVSSQPRSARAATAPKSTSHRTCTVPMTSKPHPKKQTCLVNAGKRYELCAIWPTYATPPGAQKCYPGTDRFAFRPKCGQSPLLGCRQSSFTTQAMQGESFGG